MLALVENQFFKVAVLLQIWVSKGHFTWYCICILYEYVVKFRLFLGQCECVKLFSDFRLPLPICAQRSYGLYGLPIPEVDVPENLYIDLLPFFSKYEI